MTPNEMASELFGFGGDDEDEGIGAKIGGFASDVLKPFYVLLGLVIIILIMVFLIK